MEIKRGTRFEHERFIVGSPKAGNMRPDVCTITRVAKANFWYRNESGMLYVRTIEQGIPGTVITDERA